nr:cytosolic sulfotransferase 5-like isoform X5 [Ipomoea trifida]GME00602.1 cytosolic sulfotransferase 12-like [Ipomoea batatas]
MAAPSDPNPSNSFMQQFSQESCYPKELRESIISLPREEGWLSPHMYNYKGFWFDSQFLYGALRCQQQYTSRLNILISYYVPSLNAAPLG